MLMLLSRTLHRMCIKPRRWLVVGQLGLQMTCCPVGLVEEHWASFWIWAKGCLGSLLKLMREKELASNLK